MCEYSVLIPVYNSSETLGELVACVLSVMRNYSFELIMVDDGSIDDSWDKLKVLQNGNEIIRIFRHEQNQGQSAAMLTGILHAKGTYLITIDDDLQYDPADIPKLIHEQERSQVNLIYGIPEHLNHSALRIVLSNTIKWLSSLIFDTPVKGSSFRLIHRKALEIVDLSALEKNILPDVLFTAVPITKAYVTVAHYPRKTGRSGYSYRKLLLLLYKSFKFQGRKSN